MGAAARPTGKSRNEHRNTERHEIRGEASMAQTLSPTHAPRLPAGPDPAARRIYDDGLPSQPHLVFAYGLAALSGTIMGLVIGILFF
jgi:hypothetical protein